MSVMQVPELLPAAPSASEVFDTIQSIDDSLALSHLGVMFGRQTTGGYRWRTKSVKGRNVVSRLFLAFDTYINAFETPQDRKAALMAWKNLVLTEGQRRGVSNVFQTGSWKKADQPSTGRPVTGDDLVMLRDQLNISTMATCWLLGISIKVWSKLTKAEARQPVENVSLAVLVRALMNFDEALPIPRPARPLEVYQRLTDLYPDFDKRQLAIMFGYEESSGSRWIKEDSEGNPILERLMRLFIRKFDSARAWGKEEVEHMLAEWNNVVQIEASARGKPYIFNHGAWSDRPKRIRKTESKNEHEDRGRLAA
jgi:hypothetical protein